MIEFKNNEDKADFLSNCIFSRDKSQKIRFWNAFKMDNGYVILTGVLEKGLTISNFVSNYSPVSENKLRNIDQQCKHEIESRKKIKVNDGYRSLKNLGIDYFAGQFKYNDILENDLFIFLNPLISEYKEDNKGFIKPMLAKNINKCVPEKISFNRYIQPKLNGVRCIVRWGKTTVGEGMFIEETEGVIFTSREGKIYHLPHLADIFNKSMFFYKNEEVIYDGELYIHGQSLNQIKKSIPIVTDDGTLSECTGNPKLVQFWAFDTISLKPQHYRLHVLSAMLYDYSLYGNSLDNIPMGSRIIRVPHEICMSIDHAYEYANKYIEKGFEGAILRDTDELYMFGYRGYTMLKVKTTYTTECLILNIIPKEKEPETALFILKNDITSAEFKCNPIGTFEERKEYLDNAEKYIGKLATVRYRERSGVDSLPFHANVETIRDYE